MNSATPRLLAVALIAVTSMSLVPVLIRSTVANETTIGIVRLGIAALGLTPLLIGQRGFGSLKIKDWLFIALIGLAFATHWWTYFFAIKKSSAALGAIAVSTYGIHLLWLNWLFKSQRAKLGEVLAVVLCFVGCLLVAPDLDLSNQATQGFLVGLLSGLLYATLPMLHQRATHLPTTMRSWGQFFFAGLFFLLLWPQSNWQLSGDDWWRLATLGVICTLVAHTLWVKASTELPAAFTSAAYYLYIPIAMSLSYFFLDEEMTVAKVAGALLIIGSSLTVVCYPMLRRRWSKAKS